MAQAGGGTRWLKYGCFGCLGVIVLLILFSAAVGGMAWFRASSEEPETHASIHELPAGESDSPPMPGAVIVEIEAQVEIKIEPGPKGGPLSVEASYDTTSFELEESLEDTEGSGWTYRLRFAGTRSSFLGNLSRLFGGTQPELRILLPSDVPMTLALGMSQGGAQAQLGGLSLTSAEIEIQQGGIHLEFDRPMQAPMESLSIRSSMGGFSMERLGNASPRELEIDLSMGGGFIDLGGAWVTDSDISVRANMGGAALQLPRNVHVVGVESSRVGPVRDPEVPLPTLTFSITTGAGGDVDVIE